jgi:hypothetical protein
MSRVAVLKRTRFPVENSIKESHELSGCDVLVQQTVDLAAHLGRALRVVRKRANRCLHISHQQSGRYTFADHVCDANAQSMIANPKLLTDLGMR